MSIFWFHLHSWSDCKEWAKRLVTGWWFEICSSLLILALNSLKDQNGLAKQATVIILFIHEFLRYGAWQCSWREEVLELICEHGGVVLLFHPTISSKVFLETGSWIGSLVPSYLTLKSSLVYTSWLSAAMKMCPCVNSILKSIPFAIVNPRI